MWEFAPHPPPLQYTKPYYPKGGSAAHSQQQYNIKGTTDQMKRLRHKPILYTWQEDTDRENPSKSFRTWTNTRGKKPIYIKCKHIKELKAIQVSLFKCYKTIFFCRFVFRHILFLFLSAVMSLLKKAYRSESFKEVTGRFFFFKEVQFISNLHSETNHRKWLMQKKWKTSETGFQLIYA